MSNLCRLRARFLAASVAVFVAGCQYVGPESIDVGRNRYNGIIQQTSAQQMLANIVRVHDHESPLFMDVTEVDAAVSIGGSASGSSSNIGAKHGSLASGSTVAGQVGVAGGTIQYSESPIIRYQPLLGQALVAQLVTPVSADALGLLYDSNWELAPLLDFTASYLTLDDRRYYSALDTLVELQWDGSIDLTPARSDLTLNQSAATGSDKGQTNSKTPLQSNDSLIIFRRPFEQFDPSSDAKTRMDQLHRRRRELQLWIRLLRLYRDSQLYSTQDVNPSCGLDSQQTPVRKGRMRSRGANPPSTEPLRLTLSAASLEDWDFNIDKKIPIDAAIDVGAQTKLSDLIERVLQCVPSSIELRFLPLARRQIAQSQPPSSTNKKTSDSGSADKAQQGQAAAEYAKLATRAPVMRTLSVYGILKQAAADPHEPKIAFVSRAEYDRIRQQSWNKSSNPWYTLLPEKDANGSYASDLDSEVARWIQVRGGQNVTCDNDHGDNGNSDVGAFSCDKQDALSTAVRDVNGRVGTLRRYVLIIQDDELPSDSVYLSYNDGSHWYYIAGDDSVSATNFQLLALLTTMMAVPPTTQPLSPVISVGSGG